MGAVGLKISVATLRHLREEQGFRLTDLARMAGLSLSYLSQIEAGERDPSPLVVTALAEALNAAVTDLHGPLICPNCGFTLR